MGMSGKRKAVENKVRRGGMDVSGDVILHSKSNCEPCWIECRSKVPYQNMTRRLPSVQKSSLERSKFPNLVWF